MPQESQTLKEPLGNNEVMEREREGERLSGGKVNERCIGEERGEEIRLWFLSYQAP